MNDPTLSLCLSSLLAVAGSPASVTAAPPAFEKLIPTAGVVRMEPARVRGVRLLEDGTIEPTTEWFEYRAAPLRGAAEYVFDAYESATGRPGGAPGGGTACGFSHDDDRPLYNAGQYTNPYFVGDMRVEAGAEGLLATHLDYAVYTEALCQHGVVYHAFFTAEQFGVPFGPAFDGAYPGVMLEVRPGIAGCHPYAVVNVDLTTTGADLGFRMPLDGEGAYIGIFLAQPTPGGPLEPDTTAQPVLWSTAPERAGESGPLQWDDTTTSQPGDCSSVNAPDGTHTGACELHTYESLLPCPKNLGAMVGFGLVPGPAPCADCDGDGSLGIGDFTCFRNLFLAADPRADCNADGGFSAADFECFREAYLAGCP